MRRSRRVEEGSRWKRGGEERGGGEQTKSFAIFNNGPHDNTNILSVGYFENGIRA